MKLWMDKFQLTVANCEFPPKNTLRFDNSQLDLKFHNSAHGWNLSNCSVFLVGISKNYEHIWIDYKYTSLWNIKKYIIAHWMDNKSMLYISSTKSAFHFCKQCWILIDVHFILFTRATSSKYMMRICFIWYRIASLYFFVSLESRTMLLVWMLLYVPNWDFETGYTLLSDTPVCKLF